MADTDNEKPAASPTAALQYGWAAIVLGTVPLLLALPALQLAFMLQVSKFQGMPESDIRLAAHAGYAAVFFIVVLALAGVRFGAQGIGIARKTGEVSILCDVGIYLSLLATLAWIGVGVAWHSQAWRYIKAG